MLALEQWHLAQILAIEIDQVEGDEYWLPAPAQHVVKEGWPAVSRSTFARVSSRSTCSKRITSNAIDPTLTRGADSASEGTEHAGSIS